MEDLAESSLEPTPHSHRLLRVLIALMVIALLVGAAVWIKSITGGPEAAKRQTAKISILPDTPPPPPPKEERKPEPPKDEPKQVMREEQPKLDAPKPANEPIKMDGPAGDGPSAFAAGTVNSDYKGGPPVVGASGASGGANIADRAQERFYANAVRQLLRDDIERNLPANAGELTATFSVWIEPDGSIRRFELVPTGDAARDADLRGALDQTSQRLHLPSPGSLPQPMRFRLSMRPA